jgi:hypothetical protein
MFTWKIYRDCDTLRLRKMVIELRHEGVLVHRTRMFMPLLAGRFKRRVARRKEWMMKHAERMLAAAQG